MDVVYKIEFDNSSNILISLLLCYFRLIKDLIVLSFETVLFLELIRLRNEV